MTDAHRGFGPLSRRAFVHTAAVAAAGAWVPRAVHAVHGVHAGHVGGAATRLPVPAFEPTWASLAQYQVPDWFRDAKFGMWAHWGPQCVPEQGDWYARNMYRQGDRQYVSHVARYGHPSRAGFKDVIRAWRAEAWHPEELVALYQQAGAQYFMALANHHDNFDLWRSTHQPWNSVRLGPRRDIVGEWARATRRAGLRFGVSVHAAHAWSWYEPAQGADATGPLAGVRYDGTLTRRQGAGTWWEGLDPQDLYEQRHAPGTGLVWEWDAARGSSVPDRAYCERFHARTRELMDRYDPDLVYFDDTALPLYPISDVGLRLAAHFYNRSMERHGGRLEGVITGKVLDEAQRRCMVWDIERGVANDIQPLPFQTDTCIGEWHYSRALYERHRYKTPAVVAQMLVDIVSKNGNLMLNVPLPGSGAPDDDALAFVADFGRWMRANGPAIYGSRPWAVYGEGPSAGSAAPLRAQGFNEGRDRPYTAEDIRFVQKGGDVYAFAMAWPESGRLVVRSLAAGAPHAGGQVARVEPLGGPGAPAALAFERTPAALVVTLPERRTGEYVFGFRISGTGLGHA